MIGFNPTISNVFTYPDMASQLERLNSKQSAGLRNAINTAIDIYKFKKLSDELKARDAAKQAEAERRKDMAESWADYDDYVGAKNTDWQTYDEYLKNTGYTPIQDADAYELEDLNTHAVDYDFLYGVMTSPKNYTPDQIKSAQYMVGAKEDGVFGPNTKKAIAKKLQETIGANADGIWGEQSEAAWSTFQNTPDYTAYYEET